MIARIVTINQLTAFLKVIIEDDKDLQDLWVDGEISNLTIARSGHAYFTLKDDTTQIEAVMWRSALARQRMVPREGDRVVAHGDVTFYQPRGRLQFQVDVLQPQGTGALQLKLEELRQKLEAEGIFDPSRKRPLPEFPLRIGVVTSSSGAVWHDIQHVVARRYPLADLVLAPASVQGESAPESLVSALTRLQEEAEPDVIIIGRGGGSLEDLWAFNDERVVRAIFAVRVPVISAVGHETDTTLADYVADLRAPTPSAAAELAVPDLLMIDETLREGRERLGVLLERRLDDTLQLLDDLQELLVRLSPIARLEALEHDLQPLEREIRSAMRHRLALCQSEIDGLSEVLAALSPKALMGRGFAFVCDAGSGTAVRSVRDTRIGDTIRAIVHDGELRARIDQVLPDGPASRQESHT